MIVVQKRLISSLILKIHYYGIFMGNENKGLMYIFLVSSSIYSVKIEYVFLYMFYKWVRSLLSSLSIIKWALVH